MASKKTGTGGSKKPKPIKRTEANEEPDSEALVAAKAALAPFLKANKYSTLEEFGDATKVRAVMDPWNDRSVALLIGFQEQKVNEALALALNQLILPERLTALYHRDRKELEVIWTAYKLPKEDEDIAGRKFAFSLEGKDMECEFAKSSDRLMLLADNAMFLRVSETGFRNLQSFTSALRKDEKDTQHGDPLSFYVRNIEWREEETLRAIRHLNFYLRFYDARSPYILIHPPQDQTTVKDKNRFIDGEFPKVIASRSLNQSLLQFWTAAYDQDVPTRFLLHYRILEFVASYHLQEEQRNSFKRVLSTPNILSDIDNTIDRLAGIIREDARHDAIRFAKTFEDLVDSDRIWNEICNNPEAFTKDMDLEGGFFLKALVANVKSKDAFGPKGMENVARYLRDIRNGLAHGGQAQSGRIILPTSRNFKKLLPWVNLIATAAGEVVLYEHLT